MSDKFLINFSFSDKMFLEVAKMASKIQFSIKKTVCLNTVVDKKGPEGVAKIDSISSKTNNFSHGFWLQMTSSLIAKTSYS